jgi:hypothetical protein
MTDVMAHDAPPPTDYQKLRHTLRAMLEDRPYLDLTHEMAVWLGIVRPDDPHRGPVRITRASLFEDGTTRTRRPGVTDVMAYDAPPPTDYQRARKRGVSTNPIYRSFTIVVTDNDTGDSYDHTIHVDRAIPPGLLYKDFIDGLNKAAQFHERGGICPGVMEDTDAQS